MKRKKRASKRIKRQPLTTVNRSERSKSKPTRSQGGKRNRKATSTPGIDWGPYKSSLRQTLLNSGVTEYPLELIASIALKVGGEDLKDAAHRALEVLEGCESAASERWARACAPSWFAPENSVPFDDGVREMTGNKDLEHATGKYRAFLERAAVARFGVVNATPPVQQDAHTEEIHEDLEEFVDRIIQMQRQTGIPAMFVIMLQPYFRTTKVTPASPPKKSPKKSRKKFLA